MRRRAFVASLACFAAVLSTAGVTSAGLVGYWHFDSIASGSTPDAATADGADNGAVTTVNNGVNGESAVIVTDGTRGSVLSLNNGFGATSGNGFVTVANMGSGYNTTGATWSAWVNLRHAGAGSNWPMFMVSGGGTLNEFRFNSTSRQVEIIDNAGQNTTPAAQVGPADAVALNTWHMMTFTSTPGSPATYRLYIDGVLKNGVNGGTTSNPWPGGLVQFGGRNGGGHTFTGYLDEAQIWDKALSAEKIKALYNPFVIPSYDALDLEVLFNVYDALGAQSLTTDGQTWSYVTGLTGHSVGESWQVGNSYFLQLDASGNGVASIVPEPGSLSMMIFSLIGLWRMNRKPQKRSQS